MDVDRRSFSAIVAGAMAAPGLAFAQATGTSALYTGIGGELTHFELDPAAGTLTRRESVRLQGGVQYAWPHPSRKFLYVATSSGGLGIPSVSGFASNEHYLAAFRTAASGELSPHGDPVKLKHRPVHICVTHAGEHVLIAYNSPSSLSVQRINRDGTLGDAVDQPNALDTGHYAHQIRATPDDQHVIMCTRGNNAPEDKVKTPGSLKVYSFKDGVLGNVAAVQPGDGMQFGPRHLDFHPTRPWVYVSIESQHKLYVYGRDARGLSREPLFIRELVAPGSVPGPRQHGGAIHVHPNGHFVYVTNRDQGTVEFEGKKVSDGGQNNVAAFAIDQATGEPTLIQNADAQAIELRTFAIDPSERLLVAASLRPVLVREGSGVKTVPAGLSVFRVGGDGMLAFVHKYDIDMGADSLWWSGIVKPA